MEITRSCSSLVTCISKAVLPAPVLPRTIRRGLVTSRNTSRSPVSTKQSYRKLWSCSASDTPMLSCFLKRNLFEDDLEEDFLSLAGCPFSKSVSLVSEYINNTPHNLSYRRLHLAHTTLMLVIGYPLDFCL